MSFAGGSSVGRMSRSGGSTLALQANEARVSPALSRSEEEMDAEWQRILADEGDDDGGDDEEDADDGEEGDEEVSAEELLLGFNVKSADFGDDDGGTERMEEEEPPVIERMPYKQRMKLQKAKEKAWAEKRKTFSPKYIAHLDMVEANRARAAARYVHVPEVASRAHNVVVVDGV